MSANGKLNILLVEDNRLARELAASFLEENDFLFRVAMNGQEALEQFEKFSFDVILLDIEMPVLNGFEVAKKIRESGSEIPIIAMTGHDSEKEREKCAAAGMNASVSKPFDKQNLLAVIAAYFPLTSPLPSVMEATAAASQGGMIDLTHLRSISKGRKEFFLSMIDIFLEQNQEDMLALEAAIKQEDFENIHLLAHKIATSIIFMGLEKHIHAKLKTMECLGESKDDLHQIRLLFSEVAAVCTIANEELKLVKDI